ncbi:MAG TPA: hypothetical protein VHM90_22215 [Phycisphaerae bacterium]|nr:hypothetical protein [Phycisphaerae bacterium]
MQFSFATPSDDPAIRGFLASHTMGRGVRIATQTEPSFFAAIAELGDHADVLMARDRHSGRLAGLGVRLERRVMLEGRERRAAHLSFLRVAPEFRGRRDFLRAGYGMLRDLQDTRPVEFCLTAILAENAGARRLLEAGLPGLPVYRRVAEIATCTLATPRRVRRLPLAEESQATAFVQKSMQCTPLGLTGDFAVDSPWITVQQAGKIAAAARLWDQRASRQVAICGYSPALRVARPFYNLWSALRGRGGLPPAGGVGGMNVAYVSQLVADPLNPAGFAVLLDYLCTAARQRGIDYLALSLAADHPLCCIAARRAMHRTRSVLYSVTWSGEAVPVIAGVPYVEAGLL